MVYVSTHATVIKQNEFLTEQNQYLQSQLSDLFDMCSLTHDLVKNMTEQIQKLSSYQNKSNSYSEKRQKKYGSKATVKRKSHLIVMPTVTLLWQNLQQYRTTTCKHHSTGLL